MNMGDSKPSHPHKVLGVVWLSKTCTIPEAVIYKVRSYLTSTDVISGFGGLLFLTWQSAFIPYYKVKKGYVGLGTRAARSF